MRIGLLLLAIAIAGFCAAPSGLAAERAALTCVTAPNVPDRDGDFSGATATALTQAGLCVEIESFTDGRPWTIEIIDSHRPGPLWVIPHDNEDAALIAGARAVIEYGGVLVAIEVNGQRCNPRCGVAGAMDPTLL